MKQIKIPLFGWFTGCLTLLFVAFKLLGNLTWSWLWVFSPLWLPFAGVTIFIILYWLFLGIILLISNIFFHK